MNVVRHDDEGVQDIMSEDAGVVLDGFHDHVGNGRLAKVECAGAGFVQQSIHGVEGLSGVERGRGGLLRFVQVWQSPLVKRHTGVVPQTQRNSRN